MKLEPKVREVAPILLKWLEKWGSGEIQTLPHAHLGICHNLKGKVHEETGVRLIAGYFVGLVGGAAESWPEYSGSDAFPVPQTAGGASRLVGRHLWQGEQLELRKSLCRHVSNVLREALEQDND